MIWKTWGKKYIQAILSGLDFDASLTKRPNWFRSCVQVSPFIQSIIWRQFLYARHDFQWIFFKLLQVREARKKGFTRAKVCTPTSLGCSILLALRMFFRNLCSRAPKKGIQTCGKGLWCWIWQVLNHWYFYDDLRPWQDFEVQSKVCETQITVWLSRVFKVFKGIRFCILTPVAGSNLRKEKVSRSSELSQNSNPGELFHSKTSNFVKWTKLISADYSFEFSAF